MFLHIYLQYLQLAGIFCFKWQAFVGCSLFSKFIFQVDLPTSLKGILSVDLKACEKRQCWLFAESLAIKRQCWFTAIHDTVAMKRKMQCWLSRVILACNCTQCLQIGPLKKYAMPPLQHTHTHTHPPLKTFPNKVFLHYYFPRPGLQLRDVLTYQIVCFF